MTTTNAAGAMTSVKRGTTTANRAILDEGRFAELQKNTSATLMLFNLDGAMRKRMVRCNFGAAEA